MNGKPAVSIIIPTRDRRVDTEKCLEALKISISASRLRAEVILVDDGSRDGTGAMARNTAKKWKTGPKLSLITLKHSRGPAGARNIGVKKAQAPVIAFIDSDCIPARDWLARLCRRLINDPRPLVMEGRTTRSTAGTAGPYDHIVENINGGRWLTCNLAIHRRDFIKYRGFDERFNKPCREDTDFAFKLIENGMEMAFEPRAIVRHPVKKGQPGKFIRESAQGYQEGLLFFRHPRLYLTRLKWLDGLFMPVWYPGFYAGVLWLVGASRGYLPLDRGALAGIAALVTASLLICVHAWTRKKAVSPAQLILLALESLIVPFTRLAWVTIGLARGLGILARGKINADREE